MNFKAVLKVSVLASLLTLVSCGGGGGSSTQGTMGIKQSSSITATQFVTALNNVDGTYSTPDATTLELKVSETYRSTLAGEDDWFVIWDAKFGEYKAVNLDYIRRVTYYDYYSHDTAVAAEFRKIEDNGSYYGDAWGDKYEVVDYNWSTGYYEGLQSGMLYEDQAGTKDVSLLAAEAAQEKFYAKAAKVSFVYNVDISTSMSMVNLGSKIEKMLSHSNGELTENDQAALMGDFKTLTGVNVADIQKAANDSSTKEDVLAKVAAKLGTSPLTLEQKILPEVFGITL